MQYIIKQSFFTLFFDSIFKSENFPSKIKKTKNVFRLILNLNTRYYFDWERICRRVRVEREREQPSLPPTPHWG